jgi:hypothetical protein
LGVSPIKNNIVPHFFEIIGKRLRLKKQPFLNNLGYIGPYWLHGLRPKNRGANTVIAVARAGPKDVAIARAHIELVATRSIARPVVVVGKAGTGVSVHVAPLGKKPASI